MDRGPIEAPGGREVLRFLEQIKQPADCVFLLGSPTRFPSKCSMYGATGSIALPSLLDAGCDFRRARVEIYRDRLIEALALFVELAQRLRAGRQRESRLALDVRAGGDLLRRQPNFQPYITRSVPIGVSGCCDPASNCENGSPSGTSTTGSQSSERVPIRRGVHHTFVENLTSGDRSHLSTEERKYEKHGKEHTQTVSLRPAPKPQTCRCRLTRISSTVSSW